MFSFKEIFSRNLSRFLAKNYAEGKCEQIFVVVTCERIILSTLTGYSYGDKFSVKCTNVKRENSSVSLCLSVSSMFTISWVTV